MFWELGDDFLGQLQSMTTHHNAEVLFETMAIPRDVEIVRIKKVQSTHACLKLLSALSNKKPRLR